jgi:ribonuclease-3
VNTQALTEVARALNINDCLLLSRGEAKDTGRARQFILANAVEALIGAVYADQGYEAARRCIEAFVLQRLPKVLNERLWLDAKSYFQERAQERFGITPTYQILEATGPDHNRQFLVGVFLGEEEVGRGTGSSKQEAEQQAAQQALERYGWR